MDGSGRGVAVNFTPPSGRYRSRRTQGGTPARAQSMDVGGYSDMLSVSSRDGPLAGMAMKFHRRLSSFSGGGGTPAFRHRSQRLGLLRTVDLTGESIQTYHNSTNVRQSATGASVSYRPAERAPQPAEEIDELREAVVMEVILKAADVAHNLQGWEQMVKWSNRLFLELRRAHVQGRGDDPQNGWFSNQIGFLEAYLLPLARRLDDMGVFGDTVGEIFALTVEENRDRWTKEGIQNTAHIISEAEKKYPLDDDTESSEKNK